MGRFLFALALLAVVVAAPAPAQVVDIFPFFVFFDSGDTALTHWARPILDNAAVAMRAYPDWDVEIAGYTDRAGPPGNNRRLSCERARAVRAYLLSRGAASDHLITIGYGEDRPLVPTADGVAEPQNRRVEIVFGTRDRAVEENPPATIC